MLFYLGTHMVSHARHFDRCCISVNVLRRCKADFAVHTWMLDSGAFTELSQYGAYQHSVESYANEINRWRNCGNLELAVSQDYMCEPFILEKTGLSLRNHQSLTIDRYDELIGLTDTTIMPVLQGYDPRDYIDHIKMYGKRLQNSMRVGVGSVCKRNAKPQAIIAVLEAIRVVRPDLRLHGFGVKTTALANLYVLSLLYSADSMAWSYHARRNGGNSNGLLEAQQFVARLDEIQGTKPHQFKIPQMGYSVERG